MAWNPNVPVETNVVRGASGDLVVMQGNFATLDPLVQSGLNALLSGGTAVAKGVPVARSATANTLWDRRLLTFTSSGDLGDVNATGLASGDLMRWNGTQWQPLHLNVDPTLVTGATDGQALTYSGAIARWVPATVSGSGGGGGASSVGEYGAMIRFDPGSFNQAIADNTVTTLTGMNFVVRNVGGFTTTNSGIQVPTGSGYTHVKVFAEVQWAPNVTGFRQLFIWQDGGHPLGPAGSPYGHVRVLSPAIGSVNMQQQIQTFRFPVSGGEVFSIVGQQGTGANLNVIHGVLTWLEVLAYKLVSGGVG